MKRMNFKKLLFIGVVIYFVITVTNQQVEIDKYDSKIDMYKVEIESTNKLINTYNNKENIDEVEYIEDVAREKLGLVKPYEKVFIDINK